ncbi:MAG: dihydrofolate reductase family protein [Bacteroidia bacterium]
MPRQLILYIATSLDGYIAQPGDDLSFLNSVQREGEDYGYTEFTSGVDTVIMGRKTFDWVYKAIAALPHPEKDTYVITHTERPAMGKTVFYTGDVVQLVQRLKNETGKNIYCDGGAEIVNVLLKHQLIDELIISVIPVMLGGGKKLFTDAYPLQQLKLISAKSFDSGLVQLHYARVSAS